MLILISSTTHQIIAQTVQPFKDPRLEENLQKNQLNEAKTLIEAKLAQEEQLSLEQTVYYLNRKSQAELQQGGFTESLASAKSSEKLLASGPQSSQWGDTFRSLCYAYIRTGKLDSALIYAEKLYDFSKMENNSLFRRAALVAMGNISLQNKRYQKSLDFYLEALSVTESTKDSSNYKVDFYNAGLAFSSLKKHKEALEYLNKAALLAEKEPDKRLLARIYGTIADTYLDQNLYEPQLKYLAKANEIAVQIADNHLLAMGHANLTETYIKTGKYQNAIQSGNESLTFLTLKPSIQLQAKVDSMLYVAYKQVGYFPKALEQLEKYDHAKESIRSEVQKQKLNELFVSFEVEKKNLLLLAQENEIKEEKVKSTLYLVTILALLVVLGFIVYINRKNSQTRTILFRKEKELDFQIHNLKILNDNHLSIDSDSEKDALGYETDNLQKLFAEILLLIEEKKFYRNPELNQKTIVQELGSNRQYVYEAISKGGENNFRGMVNRIRINETKRLIENNIANHQKIDLTLLHGQVGFKSYSTFFRAFKNITGITPVDYIEESKKIKSETERDI
jgi:AraC-like DNA-binding protein